MWQRLMRIDRRWIFLAIGLVVASPFIFGWSLPLGRPSPPTKALFDFIEKLPPRSAVMIAFDYGPASMPELQPMAVALARHVLSRNLRLIGISLYPQGTSLCQQAFMKAASEYGAKEGVDWVNLGYRPGYQSVVLGMGTDLTKVYRADHKGTPISELPVMNGIRNYDDIALVIDLASGATPGMWIAYAGARFHQTLAAGITAVMATDYYPYLQSGQLIGLINGLKGAAEYEVLINKRDLAALGMTSQSIAHLTIILFVILGNIGYFATRSQQRPMGGGQRAR